MSGTREQKLTPQDNAGLLKLSAEVGPIRPETDAHGWQQLIRDLALAAERTQVLLAVHEADAPLCLPGPDGGVLHAFTDDEAVSAWSVAQHPAAPTATVTLSPPALPRSERDGKRHWLSLLEQAEAVSVAFNAAGPDGFVLTTADWRSGRPRLLGRGPKRDAESAWLSLDARAAERTRIRDLLDGLTASLDRGDVGEVHLGDQNRLGSLWTAAEIQFLSGRVRLARHEVRLGVFQMLQGAVAWGRFGDPFRSIDAALTALGVLSELRGKDHVGDEPTTWVAPALDDARKLLRTGRADYRRPEIERYLSE